MNIAILGSGVAADFHSQAIQASEEEGGRLAAVVHYAPERFDDISDRFGVPCIGEEEMLDRSDIDAVVLTTPSGQHAEQAIRAARAGKHVLVEKPMALRVADADRMIDACEQAGVRLGVVFQRRAEPLFGRIKDAIEAGDLGELTTGIVTVPYFRSQDYYDSGDWRGTWHLDGGGAVMNQGIHLVDLLVWYMGDPAEIRSMADTLQRDVEVEDALAAALRFESGALATITATTTASPGFPHRIEIFGTRGGIQVEGETVRRWQLEDPSASEVVPFGVSEGGGAGSGGDPRGIELEGHIGIVKDFIRAVQEERPPLIDGREGRRSLAVVRALYQEAGLVADS